MDLNNVHNLSLDKKVKYLFLDYVQLLIFSWTGWWTQTSSPNPLQPKIWNVHFWITFNIWWLAGLVNGLKSHPPPFSSQKMKCSFLDYIQLLMICKAGWWIQTPTATPLQPKNEMLIFVLCSTSDDWLGWSMDWNPICHLSPGKKMKMLIFGLHTTSDVQLGWSMDSSCIQHPSLAKNMKCTFLDYIQHLMIGWACQWTQTPSTTTLQPKKWNVFFGLHSTSDDWLVRLINSNSICQPSPAKKMKFSFLDFVQLLMIGWAGQWTETPSATPLQQKKWNAHFWITFNFWWLAGLVNGLKPHPPPLFGQNNEMLIFGLCATSDDQLGWSMDSNPEYHLSPAKKLKCSFLDYIQLLIISWAGQWTRIPSATSLLGWSMDLNPVHHLSLAKKMKCSYLD